MPRWDDPERDVHRIREFARPGRAQMITKACNKGRTCCMWTGIFTIILTLFLVIVFLIFGLRLVLVRCQLEPGMALESQSILDMAVYQNTTSGPSLWQVDSAFNVTLSTWNRNTVAKCFTTFRRVIVRVQYKNWSILQQEVPLGFGLKPRQSRLVAMELNKAHFQLRNPDLGRVLEAELQQRSNITLDVLFDARYLRNDRKASGVHVDRIVVANTPTSNSSGASSLLQLCDDSSVPKSKGSCQ